MRRQQDDWNKHLQQLQKRYDELERKLFYAQQHNQHLKDDLQQKAELINKKDDMIDSRKHQLTGTERHLDEVESSRPETEATS